MKQMFFDTMLTASIISGDKTVTRRKLKLPKNTYTDRYPVPSETVLYNFNGIKARFNIGDIFGTQIKAPYRTGDIVLVRETSHLNKVIDRKSPKVSMCFKADGRCMGFDVTEFEMNRLLKLTDKKKEQWLSPYYVTQATSRLFLEITDVRIERLQDITDEQALQEGIKEYMTDDMRTYYAPSKQWCCEFASKRRNRNDWQEKLSTPVKAFREVYESTLKKKDTGICDWQSNPYVWVIEFRKVDREYALEKEKNNER